MPHVRWKLREYLGRHRIPTLALSRAMGGRRVATLYRLTSEKDPPERVDLPTLAAVVEALRSLTGEPVSVCDLLEYDARGGEA